MTVHASRKSNEAPFAGYVLAIATQIVVFPWFGIETGLAEHMAIGLAFVGVSLARGYLLRRLFETIRMRSLE